ncbi:MAG: L-lysine 6-transaminase [Ignavibacteria bacterium]|jgi:L-lysine 6-transaminase|nr:L-lysine 6-transaminase [Ignavibacteria bacterium]
MGYKPKYYVDANAARQTLSNHMLVDGFDIVLDLAKSNAKLVDARTGKEYIDMFTSFASIPVRMNHPKMDNPEFVNYIGKLAINKIANSDIYTDVLATYVNTLFKVAVPSHFKYAFFIEGGGLAVENALKTAMDWKVRKNMAAGKGEKGTKIIHFKESFHGRTGYTMSLTNTDPNKVELFAKFDWPRIENPKIIFPETPENTKKTIAAEKVAIDQIMAAFKNNPDEIAGIIVETIQGEGGDNHFRPEFLKALRKIADENEALLIFDEVQCGLGITGAMWAHEHYGVNPDVMAFGKKMQVCGILVGERVDEVPDNVFKKSSRINSTWGGNIIDMVRSTRYLEIIEEDKLVENAKNMGNYLKENLINLEKELPNKITAVRGRGLFCAFDFINKDPNTRSKFLSECSKNGLLILPCGTNSIRFRPALDVRKQEIDETMVIIKKVLQSL